MKLRIRGHSIRLRLEQAEVETFRRDGRVEHGLPVMEGLSFVYGLHVAEGDDVEIRFDQARLIIGVPRPTAERWTGSDEVGFSADVPVGEKSVKLLVEKDFRCLHKRSGEDESDQYPHPAEKGTAGS